MTVTTDWVTVKGTDGTTMQVFVARPMHARALAGLMVLQEAFGVNEHIRDVACRFAQDGYLAVAPELFHRSAPVGFTAPYGDLGLVMPHLRAVTPETLTVDLLATYEWLMKDRQSAGDRIGAIGYCMGGRAAFVANAVLPLRAAVSYYGGGIAALLPMAATQHGPLLLAWGGQDKHIGADQRRAVNDALHAAGKAFVDVEFAAADHGFFCNDRPSYHPAAAKQAWTLTRAFFEAHLLES